MIELEKRKLSIQIRYDVIKAKIVTAQLKSFD